MVDICNRCVHICNTLLRNVTKYMTRNMTRKVGAGRKGKTLPPMEDKQYAKIEERQLLRFYEAHFKVANRLTKDSCGVVTVSALPVGVFHLR